MEFLTINSRRYVVGLYWQTLSGTVTLIKAARETAERVRTSTEGETAYTAVVLRQRQRQVGLAEVDGKITATPSLAAVLAEASITDGDGWLLRMRLPDGNMLVLGCVDGNVLPRGDFIGDEAQALERAESLKQSYGDKLSEVIEEDDADIALDRIREWLKAVPAKKQARLRPLSANATRKKAVVVVIALALVVGGYVGLQNYLDMRHAHAVAARAAKARAAMQAQLREQARRAARDAARGPKVAPVMAVVKACRGERARTPVVAHGWVLASWQCTGAGWSAKWRYAPGASLLSLPAGATIDPHTPSRLKASGTLGHLATTRLTPARNKQSAMRHFYALASRVHANNIGLTWRQPPPPSPKAPAKARSHVAEAEWKFALSGLTPFDIAGSLAGTPGVSVRQISFTYGKDNAWTVEGSLYASQ
jgi:hypothetical protein